MKDPHSFEDFCKTRFVRHESHDNRTYFYLGTEIAIEEEQIKVGACGSHFFMTIENMQYSSEDLEKLEEILWRWWRDDESP